MSKHTTKTYGEALHALFLLELRMVAWSKSTVQTFVLNFPNVVKHAVLDTAITPVPNYIFYD